MRPKGNLPRPASAPPVFQRGGLPGEGRGGGRRSTGSLRVTQNEVHREDAVAPATYTTCTFSMLVRASPVAGIPAVTTT
jgi:hypothetical protein